jgi:hypothetical protein
MNERIFEMAEQALEETYRVMVDSCLKEAFDDFYTEKFAELIIQECFQACMNEGASYEEKAAGAYQSNLYVTAIKKHFGIEE